jgi:zinc transporter ZupT
VDQRFWTALSASLLAAAITSSGIYAIRRFENWAQRNRTYFVCFAAGVLIAASILHIMPKSFAMNAHAPAYLLGGYLSLHLLNRFITAHVCERGAAEPFAIGLVPMLGIAFHSFVDGFIYTITFTVSVFTGALATMGMVLHEFPEGIITYFLVLRSGFGKRSALLYSLLAAALSTPLGMLASYPLISRIDQPVLGALLSLSAGTLIYVSATHLLPQAEQEPRRYSLVALGGGVLVAVLIVLLES